MKDCRMPKRKKDAEYYKQKMNLNKKKMLLAMEESCEKSALMAEKDHWMDDSDEEENLALMAVVEEEEKEKDAEKEGKMKSTPAADEKEKDKAEEKKNLPTATNADEATALTAENRNADNEV
ncbi:unnamed protein product [Cuscuta epithymum]|uniref:Uncharacterized protein n=1 Tax=Cuscuta epithymum TaxID=186058 RepID=A0AAV0E007_9ASTE|nr:unnamed protein product [Cuscuta epithymum]